MDGAGHHCIGMDEKNTTAYQRPSGAHKLVPHFLFSFSLIFSSWSRCDARISAFLAVSPMKRKRLAACLTCCLYSMSWLPPGPSGLARLPADTMSSHVTDNSSQTETDGRLVRSEDVAKLGLAFITHKANNSSDASYHAPVVPLRLGNDERAGHKTLKAGGS